jgi:hypothetical protein
VLHKSYKKDYIILAATNSMNGRALNLRVKYFKRTRKNPIRSRKGKRFSFVNLTRFIYELFQERIIGSLQISFNLRRMGYAGWPNQVCQMDEGA